MATSLRIPFQPRGALRGNAGSCLFLPFVLLTCLSLLHSGACSNSARAGQEDGVQSERRVYSESQKARVAEDQKAVMETGAVALTGSTYGEFMAAHPLVLVLFYAPWCYWSRAALPEFDAAAKLLSHHNPPVIAAKVDCTEHDEICSAVDIREYPSIWLYIEGVSHSYGGRRFRPHIVHWVDMKVDREKKLVSTAHLDELITSSNGTDSAWGGHVVVVGAFPADYNNATFQSVARAFGDEVLFGDTTDPQLISRLKDTHILPRLPEGERGSTEVSNRLKPPFITVFAPHKGEASVHIYQGQVGEVNELRTFVRQWLFPVVSLFDADSIGDTFFRDPRPKFVLLVDSEKHEDTLRDAESVNPHDPLLAAFRAVAERHRATVASAVSGNTKGFEKQLFNILGIEDEPLPQLRIMSVNHDSDGRHHPAHKFKPSAPLPSIDEGTDKVEEAMSSFVTSVLTHRLAPYFRSEAPPEVPEPKGAVKTIVASNFAAEIARAPNVLVEFYAPWCGFCRKMEPAYKELAKRVAGVSGLVIARIDATRNEVEGVHIAGYPTVYLYRQGETEPLLYSGDRSTRDMLKWLSLRVKETSPFNVDDLMARDLSTTTNTIGSVLEEL